MRAVGLMSGTSLDGIDAALVDLRPAGDSYALELVRFATLPFAAALRERLRAALPPNRATAQEVAELDRALGEAFGDAVGAVTGDGDGSTLDFVASHGLTLHHDGGGARVTLQIADPFAIRERAGTTVIADFRRADCAAGGEGAPLVPYVDALLLTSAREDRIAVNIGGIANLTWIPRGAGPADVVAFDSGPGNMLIDARVQRATDGREPFDRDGARAARGRIDEPLLRAMLAEPYFTAPPPKSTGRERFGAAFLDAPQWAALLRALPLDDACATLTELTARTIADAIRAVAPGATSAGARVLVSGGGAKNATLMRRLAAALRDTRCTVEPSDRVGIDVDAKEAVAFAVLGYEALRERPAGLPRVTGARGPRVLGAIAPLGLRELLARVDAEVSRVRVDEARRAPIDEARREPIDVASEIERSVG